jgi:amidase
MRSAAPSPFSSIAELHRCYADGSSTAALVVEMFLGRIESYDQRGPAINAVTAENRAVRADAARLDARLAESGRLVGPLHGVPILVKDQIETAGIETNFGSVAMRGYVPTVDATVIGRLKAAGALVLAKTAMPDFAASWFSLSSRSGATRCPWSLDRDPGGSSSGSAAGVTAGFATAAIGEDTGGSIRIPAAYNNLVGVRVTPGLISRHGIAPLVASQDTAGPLTRTVADAAALLDVMVGFDPRDPATTVARGTGTSYRQALTERALEGSRIGVLTDTVNNDPDERSASVAEVFYAATERLAELGAEVVPVSVSRLRERLPETSLYLASSRADINHFLATRPLPYRDVRDIVRDDLYEPSLDLLQAIGWSEPDEVDLRDRLAAQSALRDDLVAAMSQAGLAALCYPTTPTIAPTPAELRARTVTTQDFPTNTVIASQAGLPAITVPAGLSRLELPAGIEFMSSPYNERLLISIAAEFEAASPRVTGPPNTP